MTTKERWILSEYLVARDRIENFGERLLFHREKTPFAEVDLVFSSRGLYHLIEVKSSGGGEFTLRPLTARQKIRLERARQYFEEKFLAPVVLTLALVPKEGPILYFQAPF